MRIDETPGAAHYTPATAPTPVPSPKLGGGPGEEGPPPLGDSPEAQVEVSAQARLLQRVKQAADGTSDVRKDRVAEIRERIASGAYRVDSGELARRILENLGAE